MNSTRFTFTPTPIPNRNLFGYGMGDSNAVYSPTYPNMGMAVGLLRDSYGLGTRNHQILENQGRQTLQEVILRNMPRDQDEEQPLDNETRSARLADALAEQGLSVVPNCTINNSAILGHTQDIKANMDKTRDDKVEKITDVIKQHMAAKNKIDGLIKQRDKVEKDILQVEADMAASWDASQSRDKKYKEFESWKQELERSERRLTSGIAESRIELKRFGEKIGMVYTETPSFSSSNEAKESLQEPDDWNEETHKSLRDRFEDFLFPRRYEEFFAVYPFIKHCIDSYDHRTGEYLTPPSLAAAEQGDQRIPPEMREYYVSQAKTLYQHIKKACGPRFMESLQHNAYVGHTTKATTRCEIGDGVSAIFCIFARYGVKTLSDTSKIERKFYHEAVQWFTREPISKAVTRVRDLLPDVYKYGIQIKTEMSMKAYINVLMNDPYAGMQYAMALHEYKKFTNPNDCSGILDSFLAEVERTAKEADVWDQSGFQPRRIKRKTFQEVNYMAKGGGKGKGKGDSKGGKERKGKGKGDAKGGKGKKGEIGPWRRDREHGRAKNYFKPYEKRCAAQGCTQRVRIQAENQEKRRLCIEHHKMLMDKGEIKVITDGKIDTMRSKRPTETDKKRQANNVKHVIGYVPEEQLEEIREMIDARQVHKKDGSIEAMAVETKGGGCAVRRQQDLA